MRANSMIFLCSVVVLLLTQFLAAFCQLEAEMMATPGGLIKVTPESPDVNMTCRPRHMQQTDFVCQIAVFLVSADHNENDIGEKKLLAEVKEYDRQAKVRDLTSRRLSASGEASQRGLTLTFRNFSCSDKGIYACDVIYVSNDVSVNTCMKKGAHKAAHTVLHVHVTVPIGPVVMASVFSKADKDVSMTLNCSIKTTDKIREWKWETGATDHRWSNVDPSSHKIRSHITASGEDRCPVLYSTMNKLLSEDDADREFRCYVVTDANVFLSFAAYFIVPLSAVRGPGDGRNEKVAKVLSAENDDSDKSKKDLTVILTAIPLIIILLAALFGALYLMLRKTDQIENLEVEHNVKKYTAGKEVKSGYNSSRPPPPPPPGPFPSFPSSSSYSSFSPAYEHMHYQPSPSSSSPFSASTRSSGTTVDTNTRDTSTLSSSSDATSAPSDSTLSSTDVSSPPSSTTNTSTEGSSSVSSSAASAMTSTDASSGSTLTFGSSRLSSLADSTATDSTAMDSTTTDSTATGVSTASSGEMTSQFSSATGSMIFPSPARTEITRREKNPLLHYEVKQVVRRPRPGGILKWAKAPLSKLRKLKLNLKKQRTTQKQDSIRLSDRKSQTDDDISEFVQSTVRFADADGMLVVGPALQSPVTACTGLEGTPEGGDKNPVLTGNSKTELIPKQIDFTIYESDEKSMESLNPVSEPSLYRETGSESVASVTPKGSKTVMSSTDSAKKDSVSIASESDSEQLPLRRSKTGSPHPKKRDTSETESASQESDKSGSNANSSETSLRGRKSKRRGSSRQSKSKSKAKKSEESASDFEEQESASASPASDKSASSETPTKPASKSKKARKRASGDRADNKVKPKPKAKKTVQSTNESAEENEASSSEKSDENLTKESEKSDSSHESLPTISSVTGSHDSARFSRYPTESTTTQAFTAVPKITESDVSRESESEGPVDSLHAYLKTLFKQVISDSPASEKIQSRYPYPAMQQAKSTAHDQESAGKTPYGQQSTMNAAKFTAIGQESTMPAAKLTALGKESALTAAKSSAHDQEAAGKAALAMNAAKFTAIAKEAMMQAEKFKASGKESANIAAKSAANNQESNVEAPADFESTNRGIFKPAVVKLTSETKPSTTSVQDHPDRSARPAFEVNARTQLVMEKMVQTTEGASQGSEIKAKTFAPKIVAQADKAVNPEVKRTPFAFKKERPATDDKPVHPEIKRTPFTFKKERPATDDSPVNPGIKKTPFSFKKERLASPATEKSQSSSDSSPEPVKNRSSAESIQSETSGQGHTESQSSGATSSQTSARVESSSQHSDGARTSPEVEQPVPRTSKVKIQEHRERSPVAKPPSRTSPPPPPKNASPAKLVLPTVTPTLPESKVLFPLNIANSSSTKASVQNSKSAPDSFKLLSVFSDTSLHSPEIERSDMSISNFKSKGPQAAIHGKTSPVKAEKGFAASSQKVSGSTVKVSKPQSDAPDTFTLVPSVVYKSGTKSDSNQAAAGSQSEASNDDADRSASGSQPGPSAATSACSSNAAEAKKSDSSLDLQQSVASCTESEKGERSCSSTSRKSNLVSEAVQSQPSVSSSAAQTTTSHASSLRSILKKNKDSDKDSKQAAQTSVSTEKEASTSSSGSAKSSSSASKSDSSDSGEGEASSRNDARADNVDSTNGPERSPDPGRVLQVSAPESEMNVPMFEVSAPECGSGGPCPPGISISAPGTGVTLAGCPITNAVEEDSLLSATSTEASVWKGLGASVKRGKSADPDKARDSPGSDASPGTGQEKTPSPGVTPAPTLSKKTGSISGRNLPDDKAPGSKSSSGREPKSSAPGVDGGKKSAAANAAKSEVPKSTATLPAGQSAPLSSEGNSPEPEDSLSAFKVNFTGPKKQFPDMPAQRPRDNAKPESNATDSKKQSPGYAFNVLSMGPGVESPFSAGSGSVLDFSSFDLLNPGASMMGMLSAAATSIGSTISQFHPANIIAEFEENVVEPKPDLSRSKGSTLNSTAPKDSASMAGSQVRSSSLDLEPPANVLGSTTKTSQRSENKSSFSGVKNRGSASGVKPKKALGIKPTSLRSQPIATATITDSAPSAEDIVSESEEEAADHPKGTASESKQEAGEESEISQSKPKPEKVTVLSSKTMPRLVLSSLGIRKKTPWTINKASEQSSLDPEWVPRADASGSEISFRSSGSDVGSPASDQSIPEAENRKPANPHRLRGQRTPSVEEHLETVYGNEESAERTDDAEDVWDPTLSGESRDQSRMQSASHVPEES